MDGKYTDEEICDLMEAAVMDSFECQDCGSPLECDARTCGECGWENPLIKLGLI